MDIFFRGATSAARSACTGSGSPRMLPRHAARQRLFRGNKRAPGPRFYFGHAGHEGGELFVSAFLSERGRLSVFYARGFESRHLLCHAGLHSSHRVILLSNHVSLLSNELLHSRHLVCLLCPRSSHGGCVLRLQGRHTINERLEARAALGLAPLSLFLLSPPACKNRI